MIDALSFRGKPGKQGTPSISPSFLPFLPPSRTSAQANGTAAPGRDAGKPASRGRAAGPLARDPYFPPPGLSPSGVTVSANCFKVGIGPLAPGLARVRPSRPLLGQTHN